MKWFRHPSITPLALRLAAVSFFLNLAIETSQVFLPLYARELGSSDVLVGLTVTAHGVAFFFSSLVCGRLSDAHGRLLFVRYGLALSAPAYFLQVFAPGPIWLLLTRAFVGLCLGMTTAAVIAYTYDIQNQVGGFASYGALGWLFGAVASATLRDYHTLFIASALASAIAFVLALPFEEGPKRVKSTTPLWPLIKANRKVYLSLSLRQIGSGAVFAMLPLFLSGLGASRAWIGSLDAINVGGQFVAMRFVERFNVGLAFRAGILLSVIVFVIYAVTPGYWQLVPVQVMLAVGWSCMFVGGLCYLMRANADRGAVSSVMYSSIYLLGGGLGPFVGGGISQLWGFRVVMWVGAAFAIAGFVTARGLPKDPVCKIT